MAESVVKFVVPQKGLRVICPELSTPLPESGDEKVLSPYWHKREQSGDVAFFKDQAEAEAAKLKAASEGESTAKTVAKKAPKKSTARKA